MTAIKLFKGGFGHVSMLNAASDLVTHAHPEAHIIVWLDGGAGRIQVGDRTIEPGRELAIGVNAFEPHSHCFEVGSEPGSFLAFYIHTDWAAERLGLRTGSALFPQPEIILEPWLRALCIGLFDGLADHGGVDDLAAYEVERLVECLFDSVDERRAMHAPSPRRVDIRLDFRVRKAIELMRRDLCGRVGFDDLARMVGLSRPHFFAMFKGQMNITPNVYWNTLRMEEAMRQLQTSDDTLISVACNLGFTTQGNFTRFFRDHAGVPPTLYREAARAA